MEKELRDRIMDMTINIRRRLESDILAQLEGTYGLNGDGRFEPAQSMPMLQQNPVLARERQDLETAVRHEMARDQTLTPADALLRFAREVAFTYLNRLAALRMMEARGLVQESIGKGLDSAGFRTFQVAFSGVTPSAEAGYRRYLELLFDEAALELPVLFDRSLPASVIFPSAPALKDVLAELNRGDLESVWLEDETIGWIYQYFTPREQREQARKESQAPRNSYELAFRNQFYTPNYVVRFLADNTLGRLWYEMYGDTSLVDRCAHLVRRPDEQVEKRDRKDPKEIRVLDPACGSGHFLLYAFELLALMYEESGYGPREIPALILRHNLFGIDIDLRATQMTALSLWLKAQKYLRERGIRPDQAIPVRRTNIVCAEPMPGEQALFREFLQGLELRPTTEVVRRLAESIWPEMDRAGEIGSLLKIEQTVAALRQEMRDKHNEEFWQHVQADLLEALAAYAATAPGAVDRRLFAEDGAQGVRLIEMLSHRYDVVLMNPPFGDATPDSKEYLEQVDPHTKNDLYATFIERMLGMLAPGGALGVLHPRTGFFLVSFTGLREEVILKQATINVVADLGYGVLDAAKVEAAATVLVKSRSRKPGTWFRSLKTGDKPGHLLESIRSLCRGEQPDLIHLVQQDTFSLVPSSPFCYWVSDRLRRLFAELPRLEGSGAEVRQGLATADDFRFVRTAWEVPLDQIGWGKRWVPFAKGGEYSPYYDDIHLVVDWADDGKSIKAFGTEGGGRGSARPQNTGYYGRSGLTYPIRAMLFNPRVLPEGCIISHRGPGLFPMKVSPLSLLGLLSSRPVEFFLSFSLGYADADPAAVSAAYEVGIVQRLPWPAIPVEAEQDLQAAALDCVAARQVADRFDETTHLFVLPGLLGADGTTLLHRFICAQARMHSDVIRQLEAAYRADTLAIKLYGLREQDRIALEQDIVINPATLPSDPQLVTDERLDAAFRTKGPVPGFHAEATDGDATRTRRVWVAGERQHHRTLADLAILFGVHPSVVSERITHLGLVRQDEFAQAVQELLSYAVGVAFGRWDVRYGARLIEAPGIPDPFAALSPSSPGMLTGVSGLPARPHELPPDYPVSIPWDGIIPQDEGHPKNLVTRVRTILASLFADCDQLTLEREISRVLETLDLDAWFPLRFFPFHIKQYWKSRRRAPIYWQLRSARKSYGLWLYYHRLTRDTLYVALRDYVEPKLSHEQDTLQQLRRQLDQMRMAGAREERALSKQVDAQDDLVREIAAFRDEIKAVADAGYDPDLNDGVLINIAPLHRLVPWKDAETCYKELKTGAYPWSSMSQRYKFR